MKIGFIGLGIMGNRMAANLQKKGHSLVVFNRTCAKAEPLIAEGAEWADSPAVLARQVEVIFTMLAHPDAVEEAALGGDGFLRGAFKNRRNGRSRRGNEAEFASGPQSASLPRRLRLLERALGFLRHPGSAQMWIDCSTVNPSFSRKMAVEANARGVSFLGAPVTGSKGQAELAKLTFWVGGEESDLETCRPLLECMGNRIVHCGGPGTGASLKMVMNQLLGTTMAVFAEGLILGESLGRSREFLFEALLGGPAAAPFLALKRERIEKGNYEPADFPLRWLQKDLHLTAVSAYETGAAMPLTNAAKELYRLAIRDGRGSEDFSAIYDYLTRNQDVKPLNDGHRDQPHPSSEPGK